MEQISSSRMEDDSLDIPVYTISFYRAVEFAKYHNARDVFTETVMYVWSTFAIP